MEEENKKERKGIKRSHNDAVRELVAFVRKRDKRLAAHQAEEAKRRLGREEEDKLRFVCLDLSFLQAMLLRIARLK